MSLRKKKTALKNQINISNVSHIPLLPTWPFWNHKWNFEVSEKKKKKENTQFFKADIHTLFDLSKFPVQV